MNPSEVLLDVVENDLSGFLRWYCINARDEWYTGKSLYDDGNKLLFGALKEQGRKITDMGMLELEYYDLKKNHKLRKHNNYLEIQWDKLVRGARIEILESIVANAPVKKEWQGDAWTTRAWRYAVIYKKKPQQHKLNALKDRMRRRSKRRK